MYYNMLTSSYENLKDYKINTGNSDHLYDERDDNKYYLVDKNNNKFFDLQTRIGTITDGKPLKYIFTGNNIMIIQK